MCRVSRPGTSSGTSDADRLPLDGGIHLVEVTLDRDRFGLEIIIDGLERRLG
jgi:hypothetical protein